MPSSGQAEPSCRNFQHEITDYLETQALLHDVEASGRTSSEGVCQWVQSHGFKDSAKDKGALRLDFMATLHRSLDVFKGVLVVLMTYAHVNLTLMSPVLQYHSAIPHFIGNGAAGLCFLGFMFAYGFSCDRAYFLDRRDRGTSELLFRLGRSALLPVLGAWTCSLAWGFMCFKFPLDIRIFANMLTFRLAVGNGADFLLCFPICLLTMFPLRHAIGREFASVNAWRRYLCAAVMLFAPLGLTRCVVADCTGFKKYLNYFLECSVRELWSPNLPALPHLFYFNLGILLSRGVGNFLSEYELGQVFDERKVVAAFVATTVTLAILSYPLMTVWAANFGNLSVASPWGTISRGFSDGPSVLWLLGNLFGLELLMIVCISIQILVERSQAYMLPRLLQILCRELEHLGANVLLYLVVADMCLAGLYRGAQGQFPLDVYGCGLVTLTIVLVTRLIFYLASSSRPTG